MFPCAIHFEIYYPMKLSVRRVEINKNYFRVLTSIVDVPKDGVLVACGCGVCVGEWKSIKQVKVNGNFTRCQMSILV